MIFQPLRALLVVLCVALSCGNAFAAQNEYRPKRPFAHTTKARLAADKKQQAKLFFARFRNCNLKRQILGALMITNLSGAYAVQIVHHINAPHPSANSLPKNSKAAPKKQLTVYCSQNRDASGTCAIKPPQSLLPHDNPQTPIISQMVSFITAQDNTVTCSLERDLSLTCSAQISKHQTILNPLDNNDPLNNCCKVSDNGKVKCSVDLCGNSKATIGPCAEGGSLVNVKLNETYSQKHYQIVKLLEPIASGQFDEFKCDIDVKNDAFNELADLIDYIEKYFHILPCNKVSTIRVFDEKIDSAATSGCFRKNCQDTSSDLDWLRHIKRYPPLLELSRQFKWMPHLDYVVGHEIAHNHQYQSVIQQNPLLKDKEFICGSPRELLDIRPNAELSADILGALASNHTNLAALGYQWIAYHMGSRSRELCSYALPVIDRSNADSIQNLMTPTLQGEYFHPDLITIGTLHIKLSTMIKAVADYFDRIATGLSEL